MKISSVWAPLTEFGLFWEQVVALMSSGLFTHVSTGSALGTLRKCKNRTVRSTSWERLEMAAFTSLIVLLPLLNKYCSISCWEKLETAAFTCMTVLLPVLYKYCHSDTVWLINACSVRISSFWASLTEFGLFWAYAVALISSDLSAHVSTDVMCTQNTEKSLKSQSGLNYVREAWNVSIHLSHCNFAFLE